jgi:hypothetical protein
MTLTPGERGRQSLTVALTGQQRSIADTVGTIAIVALRR